MLQGALNHSGASAQQEKQTNSVKGWRENGQSLLTVVCKPRAMPTAILGSRTAAFADGTC